MRSFVSIFALSTALLACGGSPAPATPGATSPTAEAPAAGSADSAPPAADSAAADPSAAPAAKGAAKGKGVPEEKMRAAKSLEEPFPKIDATTAELGEPVAKGKAARRAWWFNKKPLGKTFSCRTIDLIRGPSGAVVFDVSVYTSGQCKTVKATDAQVAELLAALSGEPAPSKPIIQIMVQGITGKTFDEAAALFEKKLGKANETGEPDFAAWSYVDDNQECRSVMVTSYLMSGAGQVLWGVPCK